MVTINPVYDLRPDHNELQQRMERFAEAIRGAGIKLTHQRIEIFREVAANTDHPDAVTIYHGVRKRMPTVSLDTVYRTLGLFVDLGLISTMGPPRDRARFDPDTTPHHHFVCNKCATAYDLHSRAFDDLEAPEEVAALGRVETTHVELRGLCRHCSDKEKEN